MHALRQPYATNTWQHHSLIWGGASLLDNQVQRSSQQTLPKTLFEVANLGMEWQSAVSRWSHL